MKKIGDKFENMVKDTAAESEIVTCNFQDSCEALLFDKRNTRDIWKDKLNGTY